MSNAIAISVIIPMYNVEKVILPCLQSLEAQTLNGIEFIFVDDCSTDAGINVLEHWMAQHPDSPHQYRLVRHTVNQGVAAARNTGLDHATGEYIYYTDADDYIEPDTLATLYHEAVTNSLDIVGCEWYLTFQQKERTMGQPDATCANDLFIKMCQGVMRWNLWLFLVKRELYEAHHIRFIPKQNMGEDLMVMMKLTLHASKVHILHHPFYHYIQTNSNSLTKNFEKCIPQITANIHEIERYTRQQGRNDLLDYLYLLKLNAKLPFLISPRRKDYQVWTEWFPEANAYINNNPAWPWYTRFIQRAARNKQFWILKLYYWGVIKVLYGIIYK